MNIVLFSHAHQSLLPLTFTKPSGELRMGILTFKERWEKIFNANTSYLTEDYLAEEFRFKNDVDNLFICAEIFPNEEFINSINELKTGNALVFNQQIIAAKGTVDEFHSNQFEKHYFHGDLIQIKRPYDLFTNNAHAINFDFDLLTNGRESQAISETNGVIHSERIFLEEGAKVEYAILNATDGPIYIGANAEVCEGSMVRGALALCDQAKLNLGTKIYGATTIGPYCKVGGEVNNSILTGYSNKGHDGFLGNSVIGEWCNLGADTNNSNLKNNYGEVKLWNYATNQNEKTGLQFCGLIMGDHAKSAINTQFNTGTVVGPFANIFNSGFPPKKIEAFSWGGFKGDPIFKLEAAYEVAEKMMKRRKVVLTNESKDVIQHLFKSLTAHV